MFYACAGRSEPRSDTGDPKAGRFPGVIAHLVPCNSAKVSSHLFVFRLRSALPGPPRSPPPSHHPRPADLERPGSFFLHEYLADARCPLIGSPFFASLDCCPDGIPLRESSDLAMRLDFTLTALLAASLSQAQYLISELSFGHAGRFVALIPLCSSWCSHPSHARKNMGMAACI